MMILKIVHALRILQHQFYIFFLITNRQPIILKKMSHSTINELI